MVMLNTSQENRTQLELFQPGLTTVGIPHPGPGITNLLVVHHRVIDYDIETEPLHRQRADRSQKRIGRHNAIVLGRDQSYAGVDQFLLRIEDIESCALPDPRFLTHAI
jgi:hypothetical protein